jgi:hypothetical protein
MNCVLSDSGV